MYGLILFCEKSKLCNIIFVYRLLNDLRCPWCTKRFDRFEDFYAHHRVQHNRDKQYSYSWVLAFVAEQVGRKKITFIKFWN